MSKITLEIRPLSVNAAWQGRRFKTKAYKAYEGSISLLMKGQRFEPISGPCVAFYTFYLKSILRSDGDNLIKCVQDCMVKNGVIQDDRYIMRYEIQKVKSDIEKIEIEYKPI
jgi:Holliday junction resolvase RusA-like endonuclease